MHLQVDHFFCLSTKIGIEDINDEFSNGILFAVQKVPSWYSYIAEFLSTQMLPPNLDQNERHKIWVNSTNFSIIANKMYWQRIDGILCWWMDYIEVLAILRACHDNECRGHFSWWLTEKRSFKRAIIGQYSLLMLKLMPKSAILVRDMYRMISTWTHLSTQLYPSHL